MHLARRPSVSLMHYHSQYVKSYANWVCPESAALPSIPLIRARSVRPSRALSSALRFQHSALSPIALLTALSCLYSCTHCTNLNMAFGHSTCSSLGNSNLERRPRCKECSSNRSRNALRTAHKNQHRYPIIYRQESDHFNWKNCALLFGCLPVLWARWWMCGLAAPQLPPQLVCMWRVPVMRMVEVIADTIAANSTVRATTLNRWWIVQIAIELSNDHWMDLKCQNSKFD